MLVLSVTAFIVVHTTQTTPKCVTITPTTMTTTSTRTTTSTTTTTTTATTTYSTTTSTNTTSTTRLSGTEPINQRGYVAYQGSLRVRSDDFINTLLDQDSPDYKEREHKYGGMVSY